jgi:O-antigen/teichoic acid export membrane protein
MLMSILFVPLYIRFLGMEAYGLVGVLVSLQGLLAMFDFGLGATFTREMARFSAKESMPQEALDLARTLEVVYWSVGITLGGLVLALSGPIARKWVKAERLDAVSISQAVAMMGVILLLQWPTALYAGGLRGLQRQVMLNVINAGVATVRGVGAILVLWLIAPTIHAFFAWQVVMSLVQTLATGLGLWSCLPKTARRPRPRIRLLATIWSYAASLSALTVVILLLGQIDKVVLSKLLPLTTFGYYTLAGTVAAALSIPPAPIWEAIFPRMSQLAAQGSTAEVAHLFHRGAQLAALAIFPAAGLLLFFAKEVLFLWTGDATVAAHAGGLVSLLALGVAVHWSVMGALDQPQMAYGWLKPTFYGRLLSLLLLGPLMVWMTMHHGAVGAALTWLVIYGAYVLVVPHFVFKRLLVTEKWSWYLRDFGLPLGIAVGTAGLGRLLFGAPSGRFGAIGCLVSVLAAALVAVALSMRSTRQLIGRLAARLAGGAAAS